MLPNLSTPRNFIRSQSLLEREMRFLVDADLPRSVIGLLQRYGHEAVDVRETSGFELPRIAVLLLTPKVRHSVS